MTQANANRRSPSGGSPVDHIPCDKTMHGSGKEMKRGTMEAIKKQLGLK